MARVAAGNSIENGDEGLFVPRWVEGSHRLAPPEILERAPKSAYLKSDTPDGQDGWGLTQGDDVMRVFTVAIRLDVPAEADHLAVENFAVPIVNRFAWWAAVVGGRAALTPSLTQRSEFWGEGPDVDFLAPGQVVVQWPPRGPVPLNVDQLIEIGRRALEGGGLPGAHYMLARAEGAFMQGEYRSAVVDSATAVEMASWVAIEAWTAQRDDATQRLVGQRLSGSPTLGRLRSLLGDILGTDLSAGFPDFVMLRNSVVHSSATTPDHNVALEALQVAADLVATLSPLPVVLRADPSKVMPPPDWVERSRVLARGALRRWSAEERVRRRRPSA